MVDLGHREAGRAPADHRCRQGHHQKGGLIGIAVVAAMTLAGAASARAVECINLADNAARLACYDTLHNRPIEAAPAVEKTPPYRVGYAVNLRKWFLENGMSYEVFSEERNAPNSPIKLDTKRFPKMTIWGYFNDATVFQMATKLQVLKHAAEIGYKTVDFWSKAGNGHYIYDVSGTSLPSCDISRRVCL